jgi:glycerol-3-phosphate O-acyltransferase
VKFIFKNAVLSRKNRWRRFGYASVNFGEPVSAKRYCNQYGIDFSALSTDERFAHVGALAEKLMSGIARVIPVLPVALMCKILVGNGTEWKSELEIKSQCLEKIKQLERSGAPIEISSSAVENVLASALSSLLGRGLVEEKNGLYRMKDSERDILNYYAGSIAHRDNG